MYEFERSPINIKIPFNTLYTSRDLFDYIVTSTTFPNEKIEEENSEWWEYSYHGCGKATFKDGGIYTGKVKYGILETDSDMPVCCINFPDGTKYEGDIQLNQLIGKATISFPSGGKYKGDVVYGLRSGKGIYTSCDGIIYDGEWKNGKKQGIGKMIKGDMTYVGEFRDGLINGFGKLFWMNGNTYEGEFNNNWINGNGTMIWLDTNEKYSGQWKNNLQNGFGVHIWYENNQNSRLLRNRYIGQWENGQRNGYGIFFYANGSKYEGYWKNNEKNGFGVFYFVDGSQYIGQFQYNRMVNFNSVGLVNLSLKEATQTLTSTRNFNSTTLRNSSKQKTTEDFGVELPKLSDPRPIANETSRLEVIIESNNESRNGKSTTKIRSNPKTPSVKPVSKFDINNNNKKIEENAKDKDKPVPKESSKKTKIEKPLPSLPIPTVGSDNIIKANPKNNLKPAQSKAPQANENPYNYLASNRKIQENQINHFRTLININDILDLQANFESAENDIHNSIFRHLSEIKRLFYQIIKPENPEDKDYFFFNSRQNSRQPTVQANEEATSDIHNIVNVNINDILQTQPNQGNNLINKDDKIGLCLELKDLWKFFRDNGVINLDFTINEFNRWFYSNPNNIVEMFMIPEDMPKIKTYDYIYSLITNTMKIFEKKNKKYLTEVEKCILSKWEKLKKNNEDLWLDINNVDGARGEGNENNDNSVSVYFEEKEIDQELSSFNYHYQHNIILLRQFYEVIIRGAYLKYSSWDIPLSQKVDMFIAWFLVKTEKKSKSNIGKSNWLTSGFMNDTSQLYNAQGPTTNEHKMKVIENGKIATFILKFESMIKPLFFKLFYMCENNNKNKENHDATIYHRFIYKNFCWCVKDIAKYYGKKEKYCAYIHYFYKEKKTVFVTKKDEFDYYENLLDLSSTWYEFCEFIYFTYSEYVADHRWDYENNEIFVKYIEDILSQLNQIEKEKEIKGKLRKAKGKIMFPLLKSHIIKQELIDEEIRQENIRMMKYIEKWRYTEERKNLLEQDINVYHPKGDDNNEENDFSEESDY